MANKKFEYGLNRESVEKKLEENPFASVSSIVYELLEDAIYNFQLAPGEKIVIAKLAEILNVSTTSVRSAMDQLVSVGLITTKSKADGKNNTYYVFNLSEQTLEELFVARLAIEATSAKICAQRPWKVNMKQLQKHVKDFNEVLQYTASRKGPVSYKNSVDLDRAFHELLVKSTGNQLLMKSYEGLGKRLHYLSIQTCKYLRDESTDRLLMLGAQHNAVYNAIECGFPDMAYKLMEDHINFCLNSCLKNK